MRRALVLVGSCRRACGRRGRRVGHRTVAKRVDEGAVVACQNINLDDIESVANVSESTQCQPEAPRREIAKSLYRTAERDYHDAPATARPR